VLKDFSFEINNIILDKKVKKLYNRTSNVIFPIAQSPRVRLHKAQTLFS